MKKYGGSVFQLMYLSFATDEFDREGGIEEILKRSRENNKGKGITGMLLYRGGFFLQLLEGSQKEVESLYEKICSDERHRNSKVIVKSNENERIFGNWTMAYKKIDEIEINKVFNILPWNDFIEKVNRGEQISNNIINHILRSIALEI